MLTSLGANPIDWYGEPKYWPAILTIFHLWKNIGMNCVIYYATLIGIDPALYEAAKIDGANNRRIFFSVTLPHLVPIICVMSILCIASIMGGDFGLFYQMPRNSGALFNATDIINTYVYRMLSAGNITTSSAVGFFQSFVGTIMLLLTNTIVRKISPENSMF
jgi:putative aldouronate transport system permease protein